VVLDDGFALGDWVTYTKMQYANGKLSELRQQLIKDATWRPRVRTQVRYHTIFKHPEDPEAANVTHTIEDELKTTKGLPNKDRRQVFRKLVLAWHPDRSESEHAEAAIQFLGQTRDWYLNV